jgi:16S rRNA (cytosine1402-N4)-methyltransferase
MNLQRTEYDYHLPVLLYESIKYLFNENTVSNINQTYIDGTLGGGGHAASILQKLNFGGKLFAFDKDTSAVERATILFEEEIRTPSPSIYLCNCSFSCASEVLKEHNIDYVDGILLDLGVSSKQLDSEQIGISYRVNCPIDMRFDGDVNKQSAKDILNSYSVEELSALFFKYGEEPKSKIIADAIAKSRNIRPIATTFDLRAIIEGCIYGSDKNKLPVLSRIFQALRIEVNNELRELQDALLSMIPLLKQGGRIVVISYHSLEDRIVKDIFKKYSFTSKINKYNFNELSNTVSNAVPILTLLTTKPYTPSKEELERNPRSRSAKMRVAERVS